MEKQSRKKLKVILCYNELETSLGYKRYAKQTKKNQPNNQTSGRNVEQGATNL